jgi:hypothetical protein
MIDALVALASQYQSKQERQASLEYNLALTNAAVEKALQDVEVVRSELAQAREAEAKLMPKENAERKRRVEAVKEIERLLESTAW